MPPTPTKRPNRRNAKLEVPVEQIDLDEALRKSRRQLPDSEKETGAMRHLRAVVRSFLKLWSADELEVDPELIAEEKRRAKKRRLKQKKGADQSSKK